MKFIELLKYIFLSIVQGFGEVLPISSSGHLIVAREAIGIESNGLSLELMLHLASLFALFFFYKKIIFGLIKGTYRYILAKDKDYKKDFVFLRGMIVSLIPTCLIGYFLDDYLDYFLNYSFLVGVFLVLNGFNLYLVKNKENNKSIEELSILSFFKIGLGQCLGLIPGFSRSGAALSMCYRQNLNKEDSQKFTFLMLFPLVLGSIILNIGDFSFNNDKLVLLIISFILTFIITFFSLGLLNKIILNNKLHYFSFYCISLGILIMFIC